MKDPAPERAQPPGAGPHPASLSGFAEGEEAPKKGDRMALLRRYAKIEAGCAGFHRPEADKQSCPPFCGAALVRKRGTGTFVSLRRESPFSGGTAPCPCQPGGDAFHRCAPRRRIPARYRVRGARPPPTAPRPLRACSAPPRRPIRALRAGRPPPLRAHRSWPTRPRRCG